LRQTDQARTDFAAIESDLEVIQKQLARLTTRRKLAGTALGIIFATMMLTTPEFAVLSALMALFDNLVRAGEDRGRDIETERLRSLQVDDQFDLVRSLNWKIGRLLTMQNSRGIQARLVPRD